MAKLLLYCTKQPPKLYATDKGYVITNFELGDYYKTKEKLNGKIVAECDFEVEEINYRSAEFVCNRYYLEILKKSCLTDKQMYDYLKGEKGYAIHIKNLHIFDEPRDLRDYYSDLQRWVEIPAPRIKKAPQNMMYAYDKNMLPYYLISIRPEWLCKILNKEKTIEVRKKVLKEMLNNA